MRILSMTATFGKLEHQILELKPGLNVIEAPNEWGKSTWCAFLVAMLYGIDTRQQTTKDSLADKERYRPWSGIPMSGRMEIVWNDRSITIERSTKGRIPMGEFAAYETESGLPVPELNAANCGMQLLGVERSVFTRAGFIRLQDMPVTQDEALRRRLNNLVTTGDESGAADRLGKQLRELKNKCRYNRSGLLPAAENERDQLRSQLQQHQQLQQELQQMRIRQTQLDRQLRLLANHETALRHAASVDGMQRLTMAEQLQLQLQQEIAQLESQACPDADTIAQKLQQGQQLLLQQKNLQQRQAALPQPPSAPASGNPDMTPMQAKEDLEQYRQLRRKQKRLSRIPVIHAVAALLLLIGLILCSYLIPDLPPAICFGCGGAILISVIVTIVLCIGHTKKYAAQQERLFLRHPGIPPEDWIANAQAAAQEQEQYRLAAEQHRFLVSQLDTEQAVWQAQADLYREGRELTEAVQYWEQASDVQQQLAVKQRELSNLQQHILDLQAVSVSTPKPEFEDELTLTAQETEAQLQACHFEQRQLHLKMGQQLGQLEILGDEDVLRARLDAVVRRIHRLEEYYRALELAQDVLFQASNALQRRFAPRISKRAQAIFHRLSGYDRLSLSNDLSIQTAAPQEDTLRSSQWRSEGTTDQLYLALRLAVAGEVTPEAPLVLDDALVRFDNERLKIAMQILQEEAAHKQVILFTCQDREQRYHH